VLIAANNRFMEPIQDFMKTAINGQDSLKSLKDFIGKYLNHWVSHKQELVFTFLTFSRIVANPRLWAYMDKYAEDMVGFYEFLLKKSIVQGSLENHHTKARAVALMSALDGSLIYLAMGETLKPDITSNFFENVFFRDIETNETRTGI
jgi:hypothetical protein